MDSSTKYLLLVALALLVLLPGKAEAFGAGNIASISAIEGKNWRHGDIEDMLATVACLRGHKWKSMMIKRVYFGNWLRDYSQAVDTATLSKVQGETIRILVWVLSFMSFGYATGEFEVTADRLGCYRPEEHIDNPKDYADNVDARKFDPRLRGPVTDAELAIDWQTGMKNYIANEQGGWATSAGYVKFSFARAIHYGRLYTHGGSGDRNNDEHLAEALRCLGQGLHCMEDFGAHTNYTELALRELGYHNVFSHTGVQTEINLHGKQVFPLVTGTFGGVDFFHSVLGEATDHFTQTQVDESELAQMNATLENATCNKDKRGSGGGDPTSSLCAALEKIPGTGGLVQEALKLKASSDAQAAANSRGGGGDGGYTASRADPPSFAGPPGSVGGPPGPDIPGTNTDPATIVPKIYPILEFRDKVVKAISAIVSKIPGLEKLIETITERVTIFVFALLAPFIMPIINTASKQLKDGSSAVVESAAKHQFEVWTNPQSTDPTHSMLSKDHFSNILNQPAGQVAVAILQYVAPRVIYAWDHTDVPVDQVLNDCISVFHHPAIRNPNNEAHRNMFSVVEKWAQHYRGANLNEILSSASVKAGKNHLASNDHSSGGGHGAANAGSFMGHSHGGGHSHSQPQSHGHAHTSSGSGSNNNNGAASLLGNLTSKIPGPLGGVLGGTLNSFSKTREVPGDDDDGLAPHQQQQHQQPPTQDWGSFQPYQSQYAGGGQQPPEYSGTGAGDGSQSWTPQGQYQGGQGAEPAYAVPTAYQQGYENYGGPPQPPQGGYDQGPASGGRQWGQGGGNSAW